MPDGCSCGHVARPAHTLCEGARSKLCMKRGDAQKRLVVRAAERIYESCAAYNLRYCSLRGLSRRSAVRNSIRDLIVLACFFVANAVVLAAIVLRVAVHVYAACFILVRAIKRLFPKAEMVASPAQSSIFTDGISTSNESLK